MDNSARKYFISYSRTDTAIATQLAEQLRKKHVNLWIDQLDIPAGNRWDNAIEDALETCPGMIVLLSKTSVESENVLDEVSYALEENDQVIPVLLEPCDIPFRLRRLQYIDLSTNYEDGFNRLLQNIGALEDRQDDMTIPEKGHSQGLLSENRTPKNSQIANGLVKTLPRRLFAFNETVSKTSSEISKALPKALPKALNEPNTRQHSTVKKVTVDMTSANMTSANMANADMASADTAEYLSTKDYLIGGLFMVSMISCVLAITKISSRIDPPIILPTPNKTTLKYTPKTQDPPQINALLNSSEISDQFNVSGGEAIPSDKLTNALLFGSNVPQTKIKLLAKQLIKRGVEIKVIQQQDNWQQEELLTTLWLKHEIKGTIGYCNNNWTVERIDAVEVFDLASDHEKRNLSGCAQ